MNKMTAAYIETFNIAGKEITTIVCDQTEFDQNIELLRDLGQDKAFETIKKSGHLPLCGRGTKTAALFNKYNIHTDLLSMIVRGKGPELLLKMLKQ